MTCCFSSKSGDLAVSTSIDRWGVVMTPGGTEHYSDVTALGVRLLRHGMRWRAAEPNAPVNGVHTYTWAAHDAVIAKVAAAGIRLCGVLSNGPTWACPINTNRFPASSLPDYFAYCTAIATRYAGQVEAYEIGNEPVGSGMTTDEYKNMLIGASAVIRAADPNVMIVGMVMDGTFVDAGQTGHNTWCDIVLSDPAILAAMDVASIHTYTRPYAPEIGDKRGPLDTRLADSQALLASKGFTKPVWVTEGNWPTAGPTAGVVSEDDQARFLVRMAIINGLFCNRYYPFQLYGTVTTDEAGGMGLIRPDGTLKPAYTAYRTMATIIDDTVTRITDISTGNTRCYRFDRSDGTYGFAAWTVIGTANLQIDKLPAVVRKTTLQGVQSTMSTSAAALTVTIGIDPVYIETLSSEPQVRGFHFTSYDVDELVNAQNGPRLAALRTQVATATHAVLAVHVSVPSTTSTVVSRTAISENPDHLAAWFALVRSKGLSPGLICVLFSDTNFGWGGYWNPTSPADGLASYYTAVRPYVQAAQAAGLEFVILADEWSALFSKTPAIIAFQTLMASARADFAGQLLWNVSNLEEDDIRPEVVELADMMGISAYVPSAITNSPSIAQMYVNLTGVSQVPSVRAVVDDKRVLWGDPSVVGYMSYLRAIASRWDKPLMLTCGYKSTVGAARNPSAQPETTSDNVIQANAWEAFLRAAHTIGDAFYGMVAWRWWPAATDDDGTTGFAVQDKPAAAVIAAKWIMQ